MLEEGWHPWEIHPNSPPFGVPIQVMREGWDKPMVCCREELHPATNTIGLYWKPTGIGKEISNSLPFLCW